MKLGMMNNPSKEVISEIKLTKKLGFDFVDLTLEKEKAYPKDIDCKKIKKFAKGLGLGLVGHTGWEIPWTSSYESARRVALKEFILCLKACKKLGIKVMNIHLMPVPHLFSDKALFWCSETLTPLLKKARKYKIKIMVENICADEKHLKLIDALMKKYPDLLLHIDVGHCNLSKGKGNKFDYLMKKYHGRVAHIHLSDNLGKEDDHFSLGKGNIDWNKILKTLKKYKYDGTFTLEIFSGEKDLLNSKKKWIKLWGE